MQVISVDETSADELAAALEGRGCVLRRVGPGLRLNAARECEVSVIAVDRACGWSAGLVTALRSSELACAAVVVLREGGPTGVAQSLRGGAVDCLVRPVPATVLLEGITNAIRCTRRWRGRVANAAVSHTAPRSSATRTHAHASLFAPAKTPPELPQDASERIEVVVRRLVGQSQLTPRKGEVLYWLFQGHRYEDIATVLGVAPRTAKFHASNLLRKLELDSRHDLPRLLARGG
ncbi:LuxR family transcriptional regulator [Enhygromyxa salina]|uniref:LuxR family transcriptional regulator n=1 Tax=Enhygromyxa salina TaxID=215803 RepID=UPI0015E5F9B5|nr:LuxR family transcriptional regulator [Enhygromyxa salina]